MPSNLLILLRGLLISIGMLGVAKGWFDKETMLECVSWIIVIGSHLWAHSTATKTKATIQAMADEIQNLKNQLAQPINNNEKIS